MRINPNLIAAALLLQAPLAAAARLVEAPPPPPLPDVQLEADGSPQKTGQADTASRGRLLYENHCLACHESLVHIRTHQTVKSLPALRAEVARWAANANLPWSGEEVEEVARYLDAQYYKFER